MLKHYVRFYYTGVLFSETSTIEVKARKYKGIRAPTACFGFRFFDVEETKINRKVLRGDEENFSGMYYFGTVYTLNQIKKRFPTEKILIRNIKRTNTKKAVKTRCGNWQSFQKRDRVIRKT